MAERSIVTRQAFIQALSNAVQFGDQVDFYRAYRINDKGLIAEQRNFMAINDIVACEKSVAISEKCGWLGLELWENMRQVHCTGVMRVGVGLPEVNMASPSAAPAL